uniref:EF-hand domain-containing protein n=1 Tax=Strongyloides stercoralis TaxID=6248 RepID=A0A0K0E793_STRER
MSKFLIFSIFILLFYYNFNCNSFKLQKDETDTPNRRMLCNAFDVTKNFKLKSHNFKNQDIILFIDNNFVSSNYIGRQISCFLQSIKLLTKNFKIKRLELDKSIFTKFHCEKLYRIMGKPYENRTYIIVSGAPYVCKKHMVIGNYIYFSANPIPAILSKLTTQDYDENVDSNSNENYYDSSMLFDSEGYKKNINMSNIKFYEYFEDTTNQSTIKCNVYDLSNDNEIDFQKLYQRIKSNIINTTNNIYKKKYILDYNPNNVKKTNNSNSNQECACGYTKTDILFCKLLKKNYIFYLNIAEYSTSSKIYQYEDSFKKVWDKIKNGYNVKFEEYVISGKSKMYFKYNYHNYINVYLSTKNANLEFFLKTISITRPFITKDNFIAFSKLFKLYTSNPNFGFTKLRKIRKKEKELNIENNNDVSHLSGIYITLASIFFIGIVPSIIFFRQQRILALKKIIEIENVDYECIELQCSINTLCTKKELIQIHKVAKIENDFKKKQVVKKSQSKSRIFKIFK